MIKPEEFFEFVELPVFTRRWAQLGLDDELDLSALQWAIMQRPRIGALVRGTHGLRKMRFAPPKWRSGKSGSVRVLYVVFEDMGFVVLALAYGKNEIDDISASTKKQLNSLIDEVESELRRRRRA
ncbi:MAG: hypothetical protein WD875_12595 [Pirellulales bacterium]